MLKIVVFSAVKPLYFQHCRQPSGRYPRMHHDQNQDGFWDNIVGKGGASERPGRGCRHFRSLPAVLKLQCFLSTKELFLAFLFTFTICLKSFSGVILVSTDPWITEMADNPQIRGILVWKKRESSVSTDLQYLYIPVSVLNGAPMDTRAHLYFVYL